jgi:hypothetical protein
LKSIHQPLRHSGSWRQSKSLRVPDAVQGWAKAQSAVPTVNQHRRCLMVGTRSLSSGAHSRDPVALPTLQRSSKRRKNRCAKERISPAISTRFGSSRLRGKNISLLNSPKSAPCSRHPASSKRGVRVVTIRGVRVAVGAIALRARGIAGRSQALSWGCERLIRARRAAQFAYGKSVWFWHPWLVSS